MTIQNDDISIQEAKSALDSIAAANKIAYESVTPPLWLRIVLSILMGTITLAGGWSSGSSLWSFVTIVATGMMLITFLSYYLNLRNKGIKLRLNSSSKAEMLVNFLGGFVTAFLIVLSIEMHKDGYTWVPYVAAVINVLAMYYILSNYSASGGKIKKGGVI